MLGAQRVFPDRQRPPVQGQGLDVLALLVVEERKVVEVFATSGCSDPSALSRIASARL